MLTEVAHTEVGMFAGAQNLPRLPAFSPPHEMFEPWALIGATAAPE
jgi:hypothetical protein